MGETVAQPLGVMSGKREPQRRFLGRRLPPLIGKGSALLVIGVVEWSTRHSSESRKLG